MNILDLNVNEQKELAYEYNIDAGDREIISLESRFIIIPTDLHAIIIQGQIDVEHKEIKFTIPALNDVLRTPPPDGKRIAYKFEMIINSKETLCPDTGYLQITNKIKVQTSEAKILEKTTIPIKLEKIEVKPKSKFVENFEIFVKEKNN